MCSKLKQLRRIGLPIETSIFLLLALQEIARTQYEKSIKYQNSTVNEKVHFSFYLCFYLLLLRKYENRYYNSQPGDDSFIHANMNYIKTC